MTDEVIHTEPIEEEGDDQAASIGAPVEQFPASDIEDTRELDDGEDDESDSDTA